MVVLKLVGAVILLGLLAIVAFVGDMALNKGRLFYAAIGRDALVSACTPPVRDNLVKRGFAPADLEFDPQPSISFASGTLGSSRMFSSPFTFSDGPDGPRVDGRVACVVSGKTVQVEVDVDRLPVRAA